MNCVVAYGYCIRKQCQWQFYVVDLDAPLGEMCTCIELVRSDDLMICWICGPYLCHRRDRRTLPAESSDRCNFTTAILNFPVTFTYPIGESRLIRRMVTFSLLYASYKYSYLLTYLLVSFLLIMSMAFLLITHVNYCFIGRPGMLKIPKWKFTALRN